VFLWLITFYLKLEIDSNLNWTGRFYPILTRKYFYDRISSIVRV